MEINNRRVFFVDLAVSLAAIILVCWSLIVILSFYKSQQNLEQSTLDVYVDMDN